MTKGVKRWQDRMEADIKRLTAELANSTVEKRKLTQKIIELQTENDELKQAIREAVVAYDAWVVDVKQKNRTKRRT